MLSLWHQSYVILFCLSILQTSSYERAHHKQQAQCHLHCSASYITIYYYTHNHDVHIVIVPFINYSASYFTTYYYIHNVHMVLYLNCSASIFSCSIRSIDGDTSRMGDRSVMGDQSVVGGGATWGEDRDITAILVFSRLICITTDG